MNSLKNPLLLALLTACSLGLSAQDANPPGRPDGPRRGGGPVLKALDANQDGTLDATEIANASKALLTLDKNGDGKLTPDELRPEGGRGPGGPDGPDGQGGRRGPGGPGGKGGPRQAPPAQ